VLVLDTRSTSDIVALSWIGYATAYTIFTTILFFILTLTNHMPQPWTIFHVIGITAAIALTGRTIQWLLH
jgi:hypothetical protein